jgi:hypothetical protein
MSKSLIYLKQLLVLLFILVQTVYAHSQNSLNSYEKYIIIDGFSNDTSITDLLTENEALIRFYPVDNKGTWFMANIWPKSYSQSFGKITNLGSERGFDEGKLIDLYNFDWEYQNTYDEQKGTAKVFLVKMYLPESIIFKIEIEVDSTNVLTYSGIVSESSKQ